MPSRKRALRVWNHELDVVGLKFRWKASGRRAISDMIDKRGSITGIRFEREPDNRADPNAIKVMLPERVLGGAHLGYVRAASAALLAPKLDNGTLELRSAKLEYLDAEDDYNTGNLFVVFADVAKPKVKTA